MKAPSQLLAARKLACIAWKILTSKQRYLEEERYLTAREMKSVTQTAKRPLRASLKSEKDVLER